MTALAYIFSALKYVIYGSSIYFTSTLTATTDVLDVLSLRFLLSFAVIWLLKTVRVLKINVGVADIFKKTERSPHIKTLLLAALFEPVLYMLFETLGISMSSNIMTAVIISLMPIVSIVTETLILKERTTLLQKIFLALGVVGVIYIAVNTKTGGNGDSVLGILFLILAVLCGSLFLVFSRKSSKHFKPLEVTYFSCMMGAVAFNAANVVRHLIRGDILHYFDPYLNPDNITGFIFLAIISTIIATCLGNFALGKIQPTTMSALSGISMLTTITVGVTVNGEHLYYFHYIGLTLIFIRMIGVSVIAIRKERKKLKIGDIPK
ncbi:MAG: DMT family transporter [Clostridia bacterium]|nr:DMT family transporter [Clostridia bacterium]